MYIKKVFIVFFAFFVCMFGASCTTNYVPLENIEKSSTLVFPVEKHAFLKDLAMNNSVLTFGILNESGCTKKMFLPPKPSDNKSEHSKFKVPGGSNVMVRLSTSAGAWQCSVEVYFFVEEGEFYEIVKSGSWKYCEISVNDEHGMRRVNLEKVNTVYGSNGFCIDKKIDLSH